MPSLALHQPDIPQNLGTLLRLSACLGVAVHVIEPATFLLDDRRLRRAGLDYLDRAALRRHAGWTAFRDDAARAAERIVAVETAAEQDYTAFDFRSGDRLLLGSESSGLPDEALQAAEAAVRVPMRPGNRSINVALVAAMVVGEALRQTGFRA